MSALLDHDRLERLATLGGDRGASLLGCLATRIESDLHRLAGELRSGWGRPGGPAVDGLVHELHRGLQVIGAEELAELSREAELLWALGDVAAARCRLQRLAREGRAALAELGPLQHEAGPADTGRRAGEAGRSGRPARADLRIDHGGERGSK